MTVSIGLGRVGSNFFSLVVGWVGLGQSADGLGWVGLHKMDPWTTVVDFHPDFGFGFDRPLLRSVGSNRSVDPTKLPR